MDKVLRTQRDDEQGQRNLRLFRRLLDRSNDLIYAVDAATARLLDANDAVSRLLGYSRAELQRMTVTEFSVTAAERPWSEAMQRAKSVGSAVFEGHYRARNGALHPVEIGLSYVEEDHHPYVIVVGRDIAERKRQEEQIARLTRLLRMQSAINSAVLRIGDRDELLKEACEIATTIGGYDSAGINIVDPDGRRARPQYQSGARGSELRPHDIQISDGTVADTSLVGRALRTGQVTVSTDLTRPEPPVQLGEELYREGVRTVVALPLLIEGAMVGAMALASRAEGPLHDDELLLLQDISISLSFALRSQRHADTIRYLAYFDPVTGLAKRSLFCQRLESILQRCFGPQGLPAVVVFDVEQLSHINERFGGNFGDLLLKEVAERLRVHADSDDHIGYLGGGAFVLVEPGPGSSDENIAALLESALFAQPFSIGGRLVRVSGRIGVGRASSGKENGRFLLEQAEAALRRSLEAGTLYRQYPLDVHSEVAHRLALEYKLRRAIEAGQFELYYRPQLELAGGRIRCLEALLRWHDPDNGLVLPSRFLPVLESSGMIHTVGNWVFQRTVEECRRLQALGIGPVRIAVNICAVQIRRRTFVNDVIDLLRRGAGGAEGYGVDLEITEAALLQDVEGASRKFRELRGEGVRIALDNYGVGHASLGLLSTLPLDLLKIDRSLIRDLRESPVSRALVTSIIGLAAACGLTTVAKGVSDTGQLDILRDLNCDQWQGDLFGPPVREHELERLLGACRT